MEGGLKPFSLGRSYSRTYPPQKVTTSPPSPPGLSTMITATMVSTVMMWLPGTPSLPHPHWLRAAQLLLDRHFDRNQVCIFPFFTQDRCSFIDCFSFGLIFLLQKLFCPSLHVGEKVKMAREHFNIKDQVLQLCSLYRHLFDPTQRSQKWRLIDEG